MPGFETGNAGRFAKGQSGNPGGRPKGLGQAIREKYGHDANKLLKEIEKFAFGKVKKCPPNLRLQALEILLERGWGKAPQYLVGDPDQPIALKVTFGGRYKPQS